VTNEAISIRHLGLILKAVMEKAKHRPHLAWPPIIQEKWEGQDLRMFSFLQG